MSMPYTKDWEDLTIRDNFLFLKVMSNEAICRLFLEKLLRIRIRELHFLQTEKTLEQGLSAKAIRLDIYVEDDAGRIFDIEMQTTSRREDALGLRTRYYQSVLDQHALAKGEDYIKLREMYIIFICTFDPFKDGLARYTFRSRCMENPHLDLEDRACRIFLNTTALSRDVDDDITGLLQYINSNTASGGLAEKVAIEVNQLKARRTVQEEYMNLAREIQREIYREKDVLLEQGRVEGRVEASRDIALRFLQNGISPEQVAMGTGLSLEEIRKLQPVQ